MPVYEYECAQCNKRFEITRGFSEEGQVCCPRCGKEACRIYTAPPLIFKGSGFYITDSRKKAEEAKPAASVAEKPAKEPGAEKPKADAGKFPAKPESDKSSVTKKQEKA